MGKRAGREHQGWYEYEPEGLGARAGSLDFIVCVMEIQ